MVDRFVVGELEINEILDDEDRTRAPINIREVMFEPEELERRPSGGSRVSGDRQQLSLVVLLQEFVEHSPRPFVIPYRSVVNHGKTRFIEQDGPVHLSTP